MSVKTHTFRGKRYKIILDEHWMGEALVPGKDDRDYYIYVSNRLTGLQHFETLIHEALHAALPTLSEPVIDRAGREIATLLWRLRYRKV